MNSRQGASRAGSGNIAWTISRRLGMVIVLALAFLLSAGITLYTLFRSGDTQVPNVVGRPEAEARKLADKAGLGVKVQRRNDSSVPTDLVIETHPGPYMTVKKGFEMTIVVSSGPQTKSKLVVPGPSSPGRTHLARRFIVDAARGAARGLSFL